MGTKKTWPTLYGYTSTGKTKVWDIYVVDNVITVVHGQLGGKLQTATETVKEGKNIGRSNETTPHEQACLQAESSWKKKQDKGYSKDQKYKDKAQGRVETENPLPMLAHKFEDRKHDLVWPVFVQPKLDGFRCLVRRDGNTIRYFSRGNKEFKTLKHLDRDFLAVMEDGQILDGELYNHGEITFQLLVSLIKDEKNPEWDKIEKYVHFYNYDIVMDAGFKERQKHLVSRGSIKKVPTYPARTEEEISQLHASFIEEGYEGTMVRSGGDEPYRLQYRSATLLKKKDFIDAEFEIVGCKEGVGKDEGKAIFRCKTEQTTGGSYGDGTFDVRCRGEDEHRREQWQNRNKYMGKMLTVKFQNFTDEGIPRIPVGIVVRDYE